NAEVDALIDRTSYSPDDFDVHAETLKPGGRAASTIGAAGEGPGRTNVMAAPTAENLERVSALVSDGSVRIPIQRSHTLDDGAAALLEFGATHKQGKHAITI